jgi:hypothetical protein
MAIEKSNSFFLDKARRLSFVSWNSLLDPAEKKTLRRNFICYQILANETFQNEFEIFCPNEKVFYQKKIFPKNAQISDFNFCSVQQLESISVDIELKKNPEKGKRILVFFEIWDYAAYACNDNENFLILRQFLKQKEYFLEKYLGFWQLANQKHVPNLIFEQLFTILREYLFILFEMYRFRTELLSNFFEFSKISYLFQDVCLFVLLFDSLLYYELQDLKYKIRACQETKHKNK